MVFLEHVFGKFYYLKTTAVERYEVACEETRVLYYCINYNNRKNIVFLLDFFVIQDARKVLKNSKGFVVRENEYIFI